MKPAQISRSAVVWRLLDDPKLLGGSPAAPTLAMRDDLHLGHDNVPRHMPEPPRTCPGVRLKRGPVPTSRSGPTNAHFAEHGFAAQTWAAYLDRLAVSISDDKTAPLEPVFEPDTIYLVQIEVLNARVTRFDRHKREAAAEAGNARRLQTMPGVEPIAAMVIETLAPPMTAFRRSRVVTRAMVVVQHANRKETRGGGRLDRIGPEPVPQLEARHKKASDHMLAPPEHTLHHEGNYT